MFWYAKAYSLAYREQEITIIYHESSTRHLRHPRGMKRRKVDRKKQYRRKDKNAVSLIRELQSYEKQGTQLYLNEKRSRADEIADACLLAERCVYMRDFISDDADRITEIHFIRIPEQKNTK